MSVNLLEAWRSALHGILSNAGRSALTMAGIVVGVASVIVVVAIVQGLASSIRSSFDDLGSNSLTIRPYTSFEDQLDGVINRLTLDDYEAIEARVSGIREITPLLLPFGGSAASVRIDQRVEAAPVYAVTPSYQESFNAYVDDGRFIGQSDVDSRRRIAVLGPKTLRDLEVEGDPLGRFISIADAWYKIVGVMEAKGDIFGISQDDYILIPFSTGQTIVPDPTELDLQITLTVEDESDIEEVQARIVTILRDSRGLSAAEDDDFTVDTAKQLTESLDEVTNVVAVTATGMVGISLLVGGIGIMNMMFTSVTERTREIGIVKALGATRADILAEFLIEAILLSGGGAAAGAALGMAIAFGLPVAFPQFPPAEVPAWSVILSVLFCMGIGVIFGLIPAAKAANLSPIEALRYE